MKIHLFEYFTTRLVGLQYHHTGRKGNTYSALLKVDSDTKIRVFELFYYQINAGFHSLKFSA